MKVIRLLTPLLNLLHTALAASPPCTNFIVTTKVTPFYWRATFSCPLVNVQGLAFFEAYYALINEIEADSYVKIVVFDSSVADFWLDHFDVLDNVPPALSWDFYWGNVTRLHNLPVLTIAALRGIASGGGAEIAASLDIRFGSREKAMFSQTEVSVGVVPCGGGLNLLPRLVGRARALEIIIGADSIDATTAAEYGWLNRAIPDEYFEVFVDNFARRVADWDHQGIADAKKIINDQTSFPTVDEWAAGYAAFNANSNRTVVQKRVAALQKGGLQKNVEFEENFTENIKKYSGPGPWQS